MCRLALLAMAVFLIAGTALAAEDSMAPFDTPIPGPVPARLVRVIDGDTVRVRAHIWLGQEVETNVRLRGVDTPEKRGKCPGEKEMSHKATEFVEAKLADTPLFLADVGYDKYGKRVVARILLGPNHEDLSKTLLTANLARPYDGGHKQPWCAGEDED
jgi:micrococcal nuclease